MSLEDSLGAAYIGKGSTQVKGRISRTCSESFISKLVLQKAWLRSELCKLVAESPPLRRLIIGGTGPCPDGYRLDQKFTDTESVPSRCLLALWILVSSSYSHINK